MIYLICPTLNPSGGPEALHQLAYKLKMMGYDVYMYYFGRTNQPLPDRYLQYNIPIAQTINDVKENTVIFSENLIWQIHIIKNCKRILWWLSVNNALFPEDDPRGFTRDKSIIHFSQSYYSTFYVTNELGIDSSKVFYVSDYLNPVYLAPREEAQPRKNIVLYNPKKGYEKTKEIMDACTSDIIWQPLQGFTPDQMRDVMAHSKVYIDFGEHPGMDRIPREAAMCGCCVLTNMNGSACNNVDVPIPDSCKFEHDVDPKEVISRIEDIMVNYDEIYARDYSSYVNFIERQFQLFEVSALHAFEAILPPLHPESSPEELLNLMLDGIDNNSLQAAFWAMVKYRMCGYEENAYYLYLESILRCTIDENAEAYYVINKARNNFPEVTEIEDLYNQVRDFFTK